MLMSWIYARAPLWLQNLGIGLQGLGYRRQRLGGGFPRFVEGYRERESWGRERLDEYVARELRALLEHAAKSVPYYRVRWGDADFARFAPADLTRLPVTPRADLRWNPEAFVSEAAGPARHLRRRHTGGSTGTPVTIYYAPDDRRRSIAVREARSFAWAGATAGMRRSMLGGRMALPPLDAPPPYYRWNWAERQVYFSAYHISRPHTADYVKGLNRYRPLLLTGYADPHYRLARFMLAERLHLDYRPRALVLRGEKLTPEMKTTLYAAFGARAYEEFGAVENCLLATECERGRLHANPDFGVVEILDGHGQPLPPGAIGRMICTGLANRTQPLIRYDIGALAAWSADECPCGRNHLPVLDPVVSRLEASSAELRPAV